MKHSLIVCYHTYLSVQAMASFCEHRLAFNKYEASSAGNFAKEETNGVAQRNVLQKSKWMEEAQYFLMDTKRKMDLNAFSRSLCKLTLRVSVAEFGTFLQEICCVGKDRKENGQKAMATFFGSISTVRPNLLISFESGNLICFTFRNCCKHLPQDVLSNISNPGLFNCPRHCSWLLPYLFCVW